MCQGFHKALESLYGPTPQLNLALEDKGLSFNIDIWDEVVKWLHDNGKFTPEMLADEPALDLISETDRVLSDAVHSSITEETPPELTRQLEQNTFVFSGFKSYHELKEASLKLKNEKGGFRSFEEFKKEVLKVHNTYNVNYLNSEYNFAVNSAQMAVKWADFEEDGDRYDLQYRTAGDSKVRPEHEELNGTTLPFDDPFWEEFMPPLGWNCRCTAVQVRKGKYPLSDSAAAIEAGERATDSPKLKIFRFNPGKQGKVFPPKHPYLPKGCSNCDKNSLRLRSYEKCKVCNEIRKGWYKKADQMEKSPVIIKELKNGGRLLKYPTVETNKSDYKDLVSIGRHFAQQGAEVVLTPRVHMKSPLYKEIYGNLIGTPYERKCPDLKINGNFYEYESFMKPWKKKKVNRMLGHALKQSNRIIIDNNKGCSPRYFRKLIYGRINGGSDIEEVWIYEKGQCTLLYKKAAGD